MKKIAEKKLLLKKNLLTDGVQFWEQYIKLFPKSQKFPCPGFQNVEKDYFFERKAFFLKMLLQFESSFDKPAVKFPIKVKIFFNSETKLRNPILGRKTFVQTIFFCTHDAHFRNARLVFFAENSRVFIQYLNEILNLQEKKILLSRCSSRCVKRTSERADNKVRKKDIFYAPMSANDWFFSKK